MHVCQRETTRAAVVGMACVHPPRGAGPVSSHPPIHVPQRNNRRTELSPFLPYLLRVRLLVAAPLLLGRHGGSRVDRRGQRARLLLGLGATVGMVRSGGTRRRRWMSVVWSVGGDREVRESVDTTTRRDGDTHAHHPTRRLSALPSQFLHCLPPSNQSINPKSQITPLDRSTLLTFSDALLSIEARTSRSRSSQQTAGWLSSTPAGLLQWKGWVVSVSFDCRQAGKAFPFPFVAAMHRRHPSYASVRRR